jgi:hypothetical protein
MQLFRMGHDVYGQPVLEGVSWDLLGIAFGVAAVVIVAHAIFSLFRGKRGS